MIIIKVISNGNRTMIIIIMIIRMIVIVIK